MVRRLTRHIVAFTMQAGMVLACMVQAAGAEDFPSELVSFAADSPDPVFVADQSDKWDARIRERGWILFDRAATNSPAWRLWYTGYDSTPGGLRRLGLATSDDGVHWTRHSANPLSGDDWVEDVMIVPHEGTFYMFAEGRNDVAQQLTSQDGIHWNRIGSLDVRSKNGQPIPSGPYGTPTVWLENGVWYLFYERNDAGVWLATSTDRKVWTNVRDEPVLLPGPAEFELDLIAMNQVIKHEGRYYAYYHGSKSGSKLWCTCIASSPDLLQWTKYAANPLFPLSANKSSGIVVHDGKQFRLYTMHNEVRLHLPRAQKQDP